MATCPHCEKRATLKDGDSNQVHCEVAGTMYSCPHCEKVLGFAFFMGEFLTGRP